MKYSSGISIAPSAGTSINTQRETGCWCLCERLLQMGEEGEETAVHIYAVMPLLMICEEATH